MKQRLKDHFIPHHGNEYQPHILQKAASIAMLALVMISFTLANMHSLLWINSGWLVGAVLPSVIVDLTNENRGDGALGDLRRSPALDAAANLKAQHMASNQYFAHFAPDGTSPWFFFDQVSYDYLHAGENLAIHFSDSDDIVSAWMDSPTHRANIMNGSFTEIGIGTAEGFYNGARTIYVVQLFGTPQALAATPSVPEPAIEPPSVVAEIITEPAEEVSVAAADIVVEEVVVEAPTEPAVEEQADTNTFAAPVTEPEVDTTPVPVPTEAESVAQPESVPETETESVNESTEDAPVVEREDIIISDLATTSRPSSGGGENAIPPTITDNTPPPSVTDSALTTIGRLATSPNTVLQLLYVSLALFVIGALMLSVLIEIRRQHPVQIAYGTGLLAAMAMLLYVHTNVTANVLII